MIPFNFKVKMDLLSDWHVFLKSQFARYPFLKENEYKNIPLKEVSLIYFNWFTRIIQPANRKVHYSKEFKCPTTIQTRLDWVVEKIQTGQDLIPHQSRSLKKVKFNDGLYFDWGIHHLHLGNEVDDDGFVKRNKTSELSDHLLYVFFTEKDAYIIQVMDHSSFSKQELVGIIHKNWSEAIMQYKFGDNASLTHSLSDEDVGLLRKAGITTATEVEGNVVYGPLGGGITIAGTSGKATMHSIKYHNKIKLIEIHIYENIGYYAKCAEGNLGYSPKELSFKLIVDNENNFNVFESNSMINFKIDKP
ncbi:hypothetical protein [Paenibacillus sp. FSL R10-2788]|uniref:hypothetical protein n=1 Tax=Paenibacillus sp. FSL R10-2788 TaxID=2954694 RepID=UPI0030F738D0